MPVPAGTIPLPFMSPPVQALQCKEQGAHLNRDMDTYGPLQPPFRGQRSIRGTSTHRTFSNVPSGAKHQRSKEQEYIRTETHSFRGQRFRGAGTHGCHACHVARYSYRCRYVCPNRPLIYVKVRHIQESSHRSTSNCWEVLLNYRELDGRQRE